MFLSAHNSVGAIHVYAYEYGTHWNLVASLALAYFKIDQDAKLSFTTNIIRALSSCLSNDVNSEAAAMKKSKLHVPARGKGL